MSAAELSETEANDTPLERLKNLLIYLGYNSDLLPIGDEIHFETLLVALDIETQDEFQYVAQMYFVEDLLNAPELERDEDELDQLVTLQTIVSLPQSFSGLSSEHLLSGLKLLQFFGQLLPAGHIGMNADGELYFKYALKADSKDISLALITDVINIASFFLGIYEPFVDKIVQGVSDFEALIKDLEVAIGAQFTHE